MAGSRTRYYTADEVRRIVMDVPDDSDISDFEGEDGDDASDMFEPSSDSDDLDSSERAIEHEDNSLDQSSDGEGEARRNETTTSTRGRSRRVEEAEEGHVEEGCVEPLQEGCDHDPL